MAGGKDRGWVSIGSDERNEGEETTERTRRRVVRLFIQLRHHHDKNRTPTASPVPGSRDKLPPPHGMEGGGGKAAKKSLPVSVGASAGRAHQASAARQAHLEGPPHNKANSSPEGHPLSSQGGRVFLVWPKHSPLRPLIPRTTPRTSSHSGR